MALDYCPFLNHLSLLELKQCTEFLSEVVLLFSLILGCGFEHYSWTKLPCSFCESKARILVCNSGGCEHGIL